MQRIEYRTIDKSQWGEGPWQNEPDKIQWKDEETGYPCLIVRNGQVGGFLCGYVGVAPNHPAYGLHYDGKDDAAARAHSESYLKALRKWDRKGLESLPTPEVPEPPVLPGAGEAVYNIEVHGGLTYSAPCQQGAVHSVETEEHGICHKPEDGEPDSVWWFGFDTGHAWDYAPLVYSDGLKWRQASDNVYRDIAYVTSECQKLAKQLKAMEK